MRPQIEELFSKTFRKDVFIVGGGPSLKDFDYSILNDQVTVAINSSFEKLPNATVLYWCDEPWAAKNYDSLEGHKCKLRFSARYGVSDDTLHNKKGIAGSTFLRRMGTYGIDRNKDNVCGNHSGPHAINLIANMRPNRIFLLGFDLTHIQGHSHWHDYNPTSIDPEIYADQFIPCLNSMAEPLKAAGIKVINLSMKSALLCFEKDVIENYI